MKIILDKENGGTSAIAFNHNDIDYIKLSNIENSENAELVIAINGEKIIMEDTYNSLAKHYDKINGLFISQTQKPVLSHHIGDTCISLNTDLVKYVTSARTDEYYKITISLCGETLEFQGISEEIKELQKRLFSCIHKKASATK